MNYFSIAKEILIAILQFNAILIRKQCKVGKNNINKRFE
jgi:hypothetical protein